jgi:hypothetical protein
MTTLAPVGRENVELDKGEIPYQGCSEIVLVLRKPSLQDDDGDSASIFTTIHRTEVCTGISASIPSSSAGDIGGYGGDSKHSGGGGEDASEHVEEEPLD